MTTPTSAKPIAISYATICAAARIAPRNAYFELVAQPARMTPYTPAEVSARMYSSPALMFATVKPGHNGMTAQVHSAGINASSGAIRNRNLFELDGMTISLTSSFSTSANGCTDAASARRDSGRCAPGSSR